MKSMTFRFGLLGGLALVAIGCGDDDGAQCGAGTVFQNGQCVAATDTNVSPDVPDSTSPQDVPDSTSQPDTDATNPTNPTDTFQPDTTPTQANSGAPVLLPFGDCTNETNVNRDVSAACSMGCQCNQAMGLECVNVPYFLPGFSFCSRESFGGASDVGLRPSNGYHTIALPAVCYQDVPAGQRRQFYSKACDSLNDCKALYSGYTHCGTSQLPWAQQSSGTECKNNGQGTSNGPMNSSIKVCIIEGLFPF